MTPPTPPRRRFFHQALRGLVDAVDEVVRLQREQGSHSTPRRPARTVLRPPGARPEELFLETCQRSGACVAVCPVRAIQVSTSPDPRKRGTPYLVASERACVVCDDLSCMKACPSGALTLVPRESIRMGLAVVEESVCKRTFGEDCQVCIERCPLGSQAIGLGADGRVEVRAEGCVGCGVCEYYCPTAPRAIRIVPA